MKTVPSIGPPGEPVKPVRRYDGSGRRQRALRKRSNVIEVAAELFLRDGYAATTVASVATAAGVSTETVYKSFGGKAGLVRAIQEDRLLGAGPVSAPGRSDEMSASQRDPARMLRAWATLATEVTPLVAPIMLLVRSAAATDPDMAVLLKDVADQRLERMGHNARRLAALGGLRRGLSADRAGDVLFAYTTPELYEALVVHRGWTLTEFGDFLYRGMAAELLEQPGGETPPS